MEQSKNIDTLETYQPPGGGRAPTLVGPSSINRPTSFAYIYSRTLKPSGRATKHLFHCHNLLYL